MKFCTHCGHEISEEATVCMNCGCPVKLPKKKKVYPKVIRKSFIFFAIGAVCALLGQPFWWPMFLIAQALIGIGIYFGYRGYKENGSKIGLTFGYLYEIVLVIIILLKLT